MHMEAMPCLYVRLFSVFVLFIIHLPFFLKIGQGVGDLRQCPALT
jgi:hypothetical protein